MPVPNNPFSSSIAAIAQRGVCTALDASESFGNAVVGVWQEVTGLNQVNPPNFATLAKGLFCGTPAPILPPGTSVPQGGQCNCVQYVVSGQLNYSDSRAPLSFPNARVWGPITGFALVPSPSGGNTTVNIICRGSISSGCGSPGTPVGVGSGDSGGGITSFTIFSIRRVDGGADNCGAAPSPVLPPPANFSVTVNLPPVTVNLSANAAFNVQVNPVVTIFRPVINVNAEIVIPVRIETNLNIGGGNFGINATVNLNTGDVNFNFGGGGRPVLPPKSDPCADNPTPVRNPPPPPSTTKPKPTDPDVTPRTVIVGAIVNVSSVSSRINASVIAQSGNPNIYAPNLGFVQFFCADKDGNNLGWTADIPVKNTYQYVPCPAPDGAVGVAGTPQPGVSWTITPVRKAVDK